VTKLLTGFSIFPPRLKTSRWLLYRKIIAANCKIIVKWAQEDVETSNNLLNKGVNCKNRMERCNTSCGENSILYCYSISFIYSVSPNSLDTTGKMLNIECHVMFVPRCLKGRGTFC